LSADEIQQQMAAIRRRLSDDVAEIRESSGTMLDWKYYFKRYPWPMVAAAAAVGYLVVPKRVEVVRPDRNQIAKMVRDEEIVIKQQADAKASSGLGAIALGLLANALVRAGTAYVGQQAGKLFSGHAHHSNGRPQESAT
jgi:hypothetical protein